MTGRRGNRPGRARPAPEVGAWLGDRWAWHPFPVVPTAHRERAAWCLSRVLSWQERQGRQKSAKGRGR